MANVWMKNIELSKDVSNQLLLAFREHMSEITEECLSEIISNGKFNINNMYDNYYTDYSFMNEKIVYTPKNIKHVFVGEIFDRFIYIPLVTPEDRVIYREYEESVASDMKRKQFGKVKEDSYKLYKIENTTSKKNIKMNVKSYNDEGFNNLLKDVLRMLDIDSIRKFSCEKSSEELELTHLIDEDGDVWSK